MKVYFEKNDGIWFAIDENNGIVSSGLTKAGAKRDAIERFEYVEEILKEDL